MLVPIPGVSDGQWVIDRLCRQLGEESPAADPAALLGQLYDHLATVREDGRHTVVLLDEAQVLADAGFLAGLRGLLNLEYEERRLLTLVLSGPAELGLAVGREPALSSRVEARIQIQPMDGPGSEEYLRHRIRAAEGNPAILESGAIDALVKRGAGNPRRLNDLADGALFEAHLAGRVAATGEDVARAAAELELPSLSRSPGSGTVIQPHRSMDLLGGGPADDGPALLTPAEELYSRLPADARADASPVGEPSASPRGSRAEDTPPSAGSRSMADQTTILATASDSDDLSELLSEPARPAAARSPGHAEQTVAMIQDEPLVAEPAPASARQQPPAAPAAAGRSAAAETVALFAEPGEGEGDLEDLFADLVSED